jgi:hypothetical protein
MTDSYTDLHNRHEVYIARLATQLLNEHVYTGIDTAYKAARLILLDADNISSFTKLNKITSAVTAESNKIITESWLGFTSEMEDAAIYEAEFYSKMYGTANNVALSLPANTALVSSLNNSLMTLHSGNQVKSDTWIGYTKKNTSALTDTFNAQIRAGYSNNESLNQITKRLRTVSDGILKRNAEALGRTGLSHYTSMSRDAVMQANKDVVPNKYANTVFDNRRTLQCAGYAQNPVYAIDDKSAPTFPAHFNCRSNWLYLIAGQTEPQGTRPAVGGVSGEEAEAKFNKREQALAKRRSNVNITGETSSKVRYRGRKDSDTFKAGQIKGSTKSDSWLRNQPAWFQDSSLGPARAKLFREGVPIDKFTDMTGRTLTLKELKASGV